MTPESGSKLSPSIAEYHRVSLINKSNAKVSTWPNVIAVNNLI